MNKKSSIRTVSSIYVNRRIDLPEIAGVYAFWWMGEKEELMNSKRNVILSGPNKEDQSFEYDDWWPSELNFPCLYIGKTTNLKKRFSLHIRNGSKERMHQIGINGKKQKPKTTTCQLRYGIEHIFRDQDYPLDIIHNEVGFSYKTDFFNNPVVERFYEEDLLIGKWRPWFNIDSER